MSTAAKTLRYLAEQGVAFSRNRHFHLFENHAEAWAALVLHRRVTWLAALMREHGSQPDTQIELHDRADGSARPLQLHLQVGRLDFSTILTLDHDELALLRHHRDAAPFLDALAT